MATDAKSGDRQWRLNLKRWGGVTVRCLLVAIVVYLLIVFFGAGWSGTAVAILGSAFAFAGSALKISIDYSNQRKREFQIIQRDKNMKTYDEFVKMFYDDLLLPILDSMEKGTEYQPKSSELRTKLRRFANKVTLWGGDDVIKSYSDLQRKMIAVRRGTLTKAERKKVDDSILFDLERIFYALRKDLGHEGRRLKRGDLILFWGVDPTTISGLAPLDRPEQDGSISPLPGP